MKLKLYRLKKVYKDNDLKINELFKGALWFRGA
jgi:hypothetical protein